VARVRSPTTTQPRQLMNSLLGENLLTMKLEQRAANTCGKILNFLKKNKISFTSFAEATELSFDQ
jgi:hypothetical protein